MKMDELKIAFVGVSHWHVPLYLPAVESENLKVVAVSDEREDVANKFANQLNCKAYKDANELLDKETPDFVFAFDIHSKMPALAKSIIERKIPFSIEKPLGTCSKDVEEVKTLAEKNNVYCSIPFTWRYSQIVRDLLELTKPDEICNLAYKFIAGPPSRYIEPSPWMLHKETAGSGCMTNLGVHYIDMACQLTGSESGEVLGSDFHYMNGYDVEDYATTIVKLSSGASLTLQTGYAYPMDKDNKRDNEWNITTKKGYYTIGNGCLEVREFGKEAYKKEIITDSDPYYADYASDTIRDYLLGNKPKAGLDDLLRTRKILDQIIEKANH